MVSEPRKYCVDATMLDGAAVRIRAIRPDDQERLHEHFRGLSEQSVYFRFMGLKRDLSPADLKRLTELDFNNHVGLAATVTENGRERFVGVGRYIAAQDPNRAEVAFAVLDKFQGHGIATILLEHLESYRRRQRGHRVRGRRARREPPDARSIRAQRFRELDNSIEAGVVHLHCSTRKLLQK